MVEIQILRQLVHGVEEALQYRNKNINVISCLEGEVKISFKNNSLKNCLKIRQINESRYFSQSGHTQGKLPPELSTETVDMFYLVSATIRLQPEQNHKKTNDRH